VKRRLVVAFLVAFAIWPAVHRALVAVYDVNPWKLAGWAMYARPHFPSRLALYLVEDGAERPVSGLDDWDQVMAAEYLERRYSAGRLASPRALADRLLARNAQADGVVVEVRTRFFDLPSATIRLRVERESFRRQGPR